MSVSATVAINAQPPQVCLAAEQFLFVSPSAKTETAGRNRALNAARSGRIESQTAFLGTETWLKENCPSLWPPTLWGAPDI
jgi:hypothetical protein